MGTGYLPVKWTAPIEIMIPSATANTVGTTNFKLIALWVIADSRFELTHAQDGAFCWGGKLEIYNGSALACTIIRKLSSVVRFPASTSICTESAPTKSLFGVQI